MSRAFSPATHRRYGIQRVCALWAVPRSSLYAARGGAHRPPEAPPASRRGPRPRRSDETILAHIRGYLAATPFQGEGHRKVYAHLKHVLKIPISRTRVLRLMRDHQLLSPYRHLPGTSHLHTGTLVAEAPNQMWGTDGFRVFTVDEGWIWGFAAVDHFNSECVGWHVVKTGTRFEALEPLRQGLQTVGGGVEKDAARGLILRTDHGCQYTSDHFRGQTAFWGITLSHAFVAQPQGNGIAERFIRTLKEQVIYGHAFHNVEEVRTAIQPFIENYNHHWRLERLGFLTPAEARQAALDKAVA